MTTTTASPDRAVTATAADSAVPARVLLLGCGWADLRPALAAAADSSAVSLLGPEPAYDPGAETDYEYEYDGAPPDVLLISPDAVDIIPPQRDDRNAGPAVLRCIPDHRLDAPDLYDEADDFIAIPCAPAELLKRILRLARRPETAADAANSETIRVGGIVLNPATYQVTADGRPVDLAWLEFRLLRFLMTNLGKVFTRDQLLASVWGVANIGGTRTVDVHIRRLRYKLETGGATYFRTVKNVGYGMMAP